VTIDAFIAGFTEEPGYLDYGRFGPLATPAAVADGEVHVQAALVGGAVLCRIERGDERLGQAGIRPDMLHPPVAVVRELLRELGDDLEQVRELGARPVAEVVAREQVERHDLDAEVVAPLEELAHLRGARPMTVRCGVVAELLGPAPIAVDDHRDVLRQGRGVEAAAEPVLVEAVEDAATEGLIARLHGTTLPRRGSRAHSGS